MFSEPVFELQEYEDILALPPEELLARCKKKGWLVCAVAQVVRVVLRLFVKPEMYRGICEHYKVGKSWGGLEMGFFFITGKNSTGSAQHEVGHLVQTAKIPCLKMVLLSIASALRYWKRRLSKNNKGRYDDWWFQGQASKLGIEYVQRHGK